MRKREKSDKMNGQRGLKRKPRIHSLRGDWIDPARQLRDLKAIRIIHNRGNR